MVSGGNHRRTEDENMVIGSFPTVPAGVRNFLVTPALSTGHSVSTCGSASSPSGTSEQAAVATPVSESTVRRLNHLDIHGDDAGSSQGAVSCKKKKKITRAIAGDKSGRGLRQFSMKVCEKVESKGRTTYNEVADELVAEFAEPNNSPATPDQQQYEEKNIRRRVYDALNVLMAMDIISKDKKDIQWKGLPRTSLNDIEELKAERAALKGRVDKKTAYLQELEDQIIGLQNLILRNEQLHDTENGSSGGVALPFILVQTRPHATVEIEIAEDMQLVHFDFNSTPFELHDDTYVLKAMRFSNQEETGGAREPVLNEVECSSVLVACPPQLQQATVRSSGLSIKVPSPNTPLPGILKTRVKHDHQNQ